MSKVTRRRIRSCTLSPVVSRYPSSLLLLVPPSLVLGFLRLFDVVVRSVVSKLKLSQRNRPLIFFFPIVLCRLPGNCCCTTDVTLGIAVARSGGRQDKDCAWLEINLLCAALDHVTDMHSA